MTQGEYLELQARLIRAFDLVVNKADWRAPIDAFVPDEAVEGTGVDLAAIREAVAHFTATVPTIVRESRPNRPAGYYVKAPGYRAGPAGP